MSALGINRYDFILIIFVYLIAFLFGGKSFVEANNWILISIILLAGWATRSHLRADKLEKDISTLSQSFEKIAGLREEFNALSAENETLVADVDFLLGPNKYRHLPEDAQLALLKGPGPD